MQNINDIAKDILKTEGGFVNDLDDPGGPTNHGITLKTLQRLGHDLDQYGRVDIADLTRLGPDQAAQIFVQDYFYKPRIDQLPHMLHAPVFDMYVNSGAHAVKVLQRTLILFDAIVSVDGIIGPKTIDATQSVARRAPEYLVDAYGIERVNYYLSLAQARPSLRKFARTRRGNKGGWIKRAEKYMHPRFHLSQTLFQQRTASWG